MARYYDINSNLCSTLSNTPMLGIEGIAAKGFSRFLIGPVVDAGISKVVEYQLKNNNVEKHL